MLMATTMMLTKATYAHAFDSATACDHVFENASSYFDIWSDPPTYFYFQVSGHVIVPHVRVAERHRNGTQSRVSLKKAARTLAALAAAPSPVCT